ncbi:MAG: patatin-like phospholipase family protein [Candidatus Accumulibacter phosphatis]|jgi:NTE family protein|uniref:patatin-like phospholipase family protein n=1 Tax=Candidatus Accumulibacter sp. ACC012 TaxID=2823332 RepID=UPI0025C2D119|nr:patatin-like phospholipase family protein [Candidatus Accumulibacter sp. ACC012]
MNSSLFGRQHLAVLLALFLPLLSACASYGKISNEPIVAEDESSGRYSITQAVHSGRSDEATMILAFSGGGTRAAALAYGVLQALRDTRIELGGQSQRLLDEIDTISSVSGGSFTAAYFGLYGDKIFTDFEKDFLRRNISFELMQGLLDPAMLLSERGRTEMAANYYDGNVFKGATFADLQQGNGPLIVINATDLGRGVRFSFLQDYFDLLCSDLSSYPIASAVTASSAVPVLFHPLVLENRKGCSDRAPTFLTDLQTSANRSPQLAHVVDGLNSYALKDQRRYIHLVDGGITDNLGLLAVYEMIELAGGARNLLGSLGGIPGRRFIVISVNASTSPQYGMELSKASPSMADTVNLVTDVQLHRTNAATMALMQSSIKRWAEDLSTPGQAVESYFVDIDFKNVPQAQRKLFLNQIPTSFSLKEAQVDELIATGRELLLSNQEFQRFIRDLGGSQPAQAR